MNTYKVDIKNISKMITDKRIANAVSGITAGACDCCIKKRARWYCPADDAFLCQSCDGTVHSANSLARRHERVCLKTASFKPSSECQQPEDLPWWHRGLTRKPRTPRRHGKQQSLNNNNNNVIVPELCMEDTTSSLDGETETETETEIEELLYRVPIFDPFVVTEQEYMPSDLQDFAADVETLLVKGLEDESYGIEELGLFNCSSSPIIHQNCSDMFVKEEEQLLGCDEIDEDVINEPFELTFNSEEDDYKDILTIEQSSLVNDLCKLNRDDEKEGLKRRKILLNLDYDVISAAWATHGSPWINGHRPEINLDDCWPHCMTCGHQGRHPLFGDNQMGGVAAIRDGGREARVSRYREKRRTRLFSKKIRYEVRKLNAEKRPRMKGRFVKRSSFLAAATAFPLVSKK